MKVSVISGFYNRRLVLERTVRSVLAQTLDDFELLVFDDGSTDGTAEMLPRLSEELGDKRFRYVVFEKNRGFVQGMRDAIRMTSGEYIAVQGSGDVSLPRRLELQSQLLDDRPEVGAVGCWYANVEEMSNTSRLRTPNADNMDLSDLLLGNIFSHGEVMMRRDRYEEVGGYRTEFKNCQDYDLWLRMVKVSRLATVPELLYERSIQFDGVTYDPQKLSVQNQYSIIARRLARLPDDQSSALLRTLRDEGPASLVPASDPELQQKFIKGALRFALWDAPEQAIHMARQNVKSPTLRWALVAFARLYNHRLGRPFRSLLRSRLGLRGNQRPAA